MQFQSIVDKLHASDTQGKPCAPTRRSLHRSTQRTELFTWLQWWPQSTDASQRLPRCLNKACDHSQGAAWGRGLKKRVSLALILTCQQTLRTRMDFWNLDQLRYAKHLTCFARQAHAVLAWCLPNDNFFVATQTPDGLKFRFRLCPRHNRRNQEPFHGSNLKSAKKGFLGDDFAGSTFRYPRRGCWVKLRLPCLFCTLSSISCEGGVYISVLSADADWLLSSTFPPSTSPHTSPQITLWEATVRNCPTVNQCPVSLFRNSSPITWSPGRRQNAMFAPSKLSPVLPVTWWHGVLLPLLCSSPRTWYAPSSWGKPSVPSWRRRGSCPRHVNLHPMGFSITRSHDSDRRDVLTVELVTGDVQLESAPRGENENWSAREVQDLGHNAMTRITLSKENLNVELFCTWRSA